MAEEGVPIECIIPQWPAPPHIKAYVTTRQGGASEGPFSGLNLAMHVGDQVHHVQENRRRLQEQLALPASPAWLTQVHGVRCAYLTQGVTAVDEVADAVWTDAVGCVCVVMTADCLPILLCDEAGERVAAVHAGWRGLLNGVIGSTLKRLGDVPLLAWLGPAIGPCHFEVGEEVRSAFLQKDPKLRTHFLSAERERHYYADMYGIARHQLMSSGVAAVYGGDCCTFDEEERFYSYRRDNITGRMASLIWIA